MLRYVHIFHLLLSLCPFWGGAQQIGAPIGIDDGLINNEVTAIIQDKNGFLWFGTRGGLQQYDGYEMKLLKNDIGDGENLKSQSIEVLKNGLDNNIWIGTKSGGLSSYDFKAGTIINHTNSVKPPEGFNGDYILSLLDTKGDKLLVGTWKGFQYFNKKTGKFTILSDTWKTFDIQPDEQNGYWLATNSGLIHLTHELVNDRRFNFDIPDLNITAIAYDKTRKCLWLSTWRNGVIRFNLATKAFKKYLPIPENNQSLSGENAYKVFIDSKGTVWVGTWGKGLNRFNYATETFERIVLNMPGLHTRNNNIILDIMEDRSGLLWVCTDGAGIFKLDLNKKQFSNIVYDESRKILIGSTHVISVLVDKFNTLWLGTKNGGIRYSSDWKNFKDLDISVLNPKNIVLKNATSRNFLEDNNTLWITSNVGLIRVYHSKEKTRPLDVSLPNLNDKNAISGLALTAIVKEDNGTIWVGTQANALNKIIGYDAQNKPIFKKYVYAQGTQGALQNDRVSCLLIDKKKRLWVGTYKGLHLYIPEQDNFKCFLQTDEPDISISNNTILSLTEDAEGNIWAGTQFGLNKITVDNNRNIKVKIYTVKDGLSSDYIHAVQTDAQGQIWVSTNKGINRLNKAATSFAVFDKRDGLQSSAFSENASFKTKEGVLFFGGVEGVTYFSPDSIKINNFVPPLYFTNLKINNLDYQFGKKQPLSIVLEKPFHETESITLDYEKNIFSIDFSSMDFHAPDKNEYMYMLEGFNKDWVYAKAKRSVTYTNLSAGTYFLRVKATNSDKIWSEKPHTLKITILPPSWKTWWAYSIYSLLFGFLLWATRYYGLKQTNLQNQLRLSKVARQKEKELSDFKEKLFTNISHEFRTPLTLILGPLDDLLHRAKLDTAVAKSLKQIQKQSKRMLRMVTLLLDHQKSESGSLKLNPSEGEAVSFGYDIFSIFTDEAERRCIDYQFIPEDKFISLTFDADKLEIILFNILSNAFKFSKEGGSISFQIKKQEDLCVFSIQDAGAGIEANDIDRIFDRFYRGRQTDASNISGSGIGLSFVKELTELHNGKIYAASELGKGSVFTVEIPLSNLSQNSQNSQNNASDLMFLNGNNKIDNALNVDTMKSDNEVADNKIELPIILVVEDDADVQNYVCDILSPNYHVITANNGREGLDKAVELIPDIIVSDVMMPEMSGIELCSKAKSDQRTSHIPIILLTALTDITHQVQGIREGADVYLPKPFNSQLLLVHIHNLLKSRQNLRELYSQKVYLELNNQEITSFEEKFLNNAMGIIEANISNEEFNTDELASLMYLSKSTFYRKLKAVTGISGAEFIRSARLKFAAKLLLSGNYSVVEAAEEAGFKDVKYFRKCFQEQFGVNPSDYRKS
jgi:signal transduction histidine kinase/ligand-binding sensor domain-containing protein/DNA-binding response OmpR family regulator